MGQNREGIDGRVHWELKELGKNFLKIQRYSMKSTDCGYSGYFSLFVTLGFTSSFSMS